MPTNVHHAVQLGDAARIAQSPHQAEQHYREALYAAEMEASNGEPGPDHIPVAEVWVKLGRLFESIGRSEASERAYQEALGIYSQVAGDEYFDLAIGRDRMDVPDRKLN